VYEYTQYIKEKKELMKIGANQIIYFLLISFFISLIFNMRSCDRSNPDLDNSFQRRIDSLVIANRFLESGVVSKKREIDSLSKKLDTLSLNLENARIEIVGYREDVKRSRDALASTDRKLRDLMRKKVDMEDDDLDSYLNNYFKGSKK
jgi:hypothetical protein